MKSIDSIFEDHCWLLIDTRLLVTSSKNPLVICHPTKDEVTEGRHEVLGPATCEGEVGFGMTHTFIHVIDLPVRQTRVRTTGEMKMKQPHQVLKNLSLNLYMQLWCCIYIYTDLGGESTE